MELQIPSKKVFNPLKTPQSTFLEGIWSPRVYFNMSGCEWLIFEGVQCLKVVAVFAKISKFCFWWWDGSKHLKVGTSMLLDVLWLGVQIVALTGL